MIEGVVLQRLDARDPAGPVYAVIEQGRPIGEVVAAEWRSLDWGPRVPSRRQWRVRSAGAGVRVPESPPLASSDDAVTLIRLARRGSRTLDVDPVSGLTGLERDCLDFARCFPVWRRRWTRQCAIEDLLGLSELRFWQVVHAAIHKPGAVRYDAPTVNRLLQREATREERWQARALAAFNQPHHPLFVAGRVRVGQPGDGESYPEDDEGDTR